MASDLYTQRIRLTLSPPAAAADTTTTAVRLLTPRVRVKFGLTLLRACQYNNNNYQILLL